MFSALSHRGISSDIIKIFVKSNGSQLLYNKTPAFTSILTTSGGVCGTSRCDSKGKSSGGGPSKHQITYKPYVPPCYKDHDHKNMTLKRPMSPHMTIYTPTFTAMTSISQRITGIIITSYALLLSGGTLFLSNGVETYISIIQSMDLSKASLFIIKMIIGLPFGVHYFFGIRYAFWNTGRMLQLNQVYDSGKKAIIAGVVVALLFALM